MTKYINLLVTTVFLLIQEIIFTIICGENFQTISLKVLFIIQISLVINILLKSKKIINTMLSIITIIHIIYYVYYKTFGAVLSLYSLSKGISVTQFNSTIISIITENWYGILLLILPLIIYFTIQYIIEKQIQKKEKAEKNINSKNNKTIIIYTIAFIVIYEISILIINVANTEDIYSPKNLYYNINNSSQNMKTFGLLTTIRLDIQRCITSFKEKQLYEYKDSEGNSKIINSAEYNIQEIDFSKLIQEEKDETIKEIHEYIKEQEPTKKNEYTGMFKGKNLIVIVGESFSSLAIRKDITPTLYKLANEGVQFKNFYTPLFPISTGDGEYLTDTSLIPSEKEWSIEKVSQNYLPYSYPNVLKQFGYKTYAYHNYNYDYYNRDKYIETLGYEKYLAYGNGLEQRMDFSKKPSSDYDMVKATVDDYINDDSFLAYYITMSGHRDYNVNHSIVQKNWDKVKNLPYSEKARAYLATQIELNNAVQELINRLTEAGKLDDTVILITGDHYPYGLNEDEIIELSPYDMSDYNIERFHMPCIIYNGKNTQNITVDKYACSLDVLPTILNLYGIEYDSRLLMGKDIFSDSNPLVIFSDRSFITEQGVYNSDLEQFKTHEGIVQENKEHINKIKQIIYHKYRYSRLILENDYYNLLIMK